MDLENAELAAEKRSLVQIAQFRGNNTNLPEGLAFKRKREQEKPDGQPWESEVEGWKDPLGRWAQVGDIYKRQLTEMEDGSFDPGPWQFVSSSVAAKGSLVPVALNRSSRGQPGGPMRNPIGQRLYDEAGEPILVPMPGEQSRDDWTGALEFDSEGEPILVPAE